MENRAIWFSHYLGYTDGIKEPQKTKVEIQLDKQTRLGKGEGHLAGNVLRQAEFVVYCLTYGAEPIMKSYETATGKQRYEYGISKPFKTVTSFGETIDENILVYTLNKTLWEFARWCIDNGFRDKEKVKAYTDAYLERKAEEERRADEEQKAKEEQERREQEENEKVEAMLWHEVGVMVTNNCPEIELANAIWEKRLGRKATKEVYHNIARMHHYEIPKCKEDINSALYWLDNKASAELFEKITGIKLPKTKHERIEFLGKLTKEDLLFPKIELPKDSGNKKPTQKKTTDEKRGYETFYISVRKGNGKYEWVEQVGKPVTVSGIECFVFKQGDSYNISHAASGVGVRRGKTIKECIANAEECFGRMSDVQRRLSEATEEAAKRIGKPNPKYS